MRNRTETIHKVADATRSRLPSIRRSRIPGHFAYVNHDGATYGTPEKTEAALIKRWDTYADQSVANMLTELNKMSDADVAAQAEYWLR